MQFKHIIRSEYIGKVTLWTVSILLLFFGFFSNTWQVADHEWFKNHQKDTESHVIGRMVKSRQDGIFSGGGLNGWGTAEKVDQEWIPTSERGPQYTAYLYDYTFENYSTYNSQPGGQGMMFSLVDKLIPVSSTIKFLSFYVLTSLLTAVALTFIISWFYEGYGGCVAIFVIASVVLSGWLTVFGRNLWWSTWAFYLPMIAVMYFLKRHRGLDNRQIAQFCILIFISVSIKCFINGYEYMTTTLVMMVVPCVYYYIIDKWNRVQLLKMCLGIIIGSGVAVFLSLIMLCFQIGAVKGGFLDGIDHVFYSIGKRTHGDAQDFPEVYAASLKASTIGVVITYMNGVFLDLNNFISHQNNFISNYLLKIRYSYLIVVFIFVSVLQFLRYDTKIAPEKSHNYRALIYTTWFSILAPLSWFVIFKGHSFIHTHMSFLLWQMPFTLFGFAVVGSVFSRNFRNSSTENTLDSK